MEADDIGKGKGGRDAMGTFRDSQRDTMRRGYSSSRRWEVGSKTPQPLAMLTWLFLAPVCLCLLRLADMVELRVARCRRAWRASPDDSTLARPARAPAYCAEARPTPSWLHLVVVVPARLVQAVAVPGCGAAHVLVGQHEQSISPTDYADLLSICKRYMFNCYIVRTMPATAGHSQTE
ncbi:hypothetical protein IQ07DRAFT_319438 [Pyrenochaeta sp. DS3sAY3a]|nr:hypothetical protein IQ07DRAFT_319438 [Pyrenochaeta sp. DS3sAY3a]